MTSSLDPTTHCFREDNCQAHVDHTGPECCCCGQGAEVHEGCDCDTRPSPDGYLAERTFRLRTHLRLHHDTESNAGIVEMWAMHTEYHTNAERAGLSIHDSRDVAL